MDIESHLRTLAGVEGAVYFTEGEGAERQIVAVLHTDRNYDLRDVRAHLKERLPAYMLPRRVHTAKDVPLNDSGKIDRLEIRRIFASRQGA